MNDRIEKGEMKVEYFPTNLMLADFFTKPLMREMFRKLRSIIMGYTSIFELDLTLYSQSRSVLEYESKVIEWKSYLILYCMFSCFMRVKI